MRVHPWILSVLSVMALSAGQSGFAQFDGLGGMPSSGGPGGGYSPADPFAAGAGGFGDPNFSGGFAGDPNFVPPPPVNPAGAWDPIAAGQNGGPGYDPNRQPWPGISPFENQFVEHSHENELWFYRASNSGRKYYANVDYRLTNFRRPDVTRVGAEVNLTPDFEDANTLVPGSAGLALDFLPVDTGVLFDSFTGNRLLVNTVAVNEQHGESAPDVNGFRLEWGFREADDHGFEMSGWYAPEAHWAYSRGFNPNQADVLTGRNIDDMMPLTITNSLPLNDGSRDGVLVQFDKFFGLTFESEGGGGELNWLFSPVWRSEWYQFAPTAGMQFLYIGEKFSFRGLDSGLYTIPIPGQNIVTTRPGLAPIATTRVGTKTPFLPGGLGPFVAVAPYEQQMLSEIDSYLTGPQVGMQFRVGGDHLRLIGKSNIGLAANYERMQLRTFGVGNPEILNGDFGRNFLFPPVTASGPNPLYDQNSRFREEQTHLRLSPTTSHELMAEVGLFEYIPIVNRLHFLKEAKFRAGYQINVAFEVQRPNRTIEYNGFPLIPAIRNDQETRWYAESWNFGIHWNY